MFRLKLWNSKSDDDHIIFVKAAALDFNFISQGNSLLKLQALASCDRPKFSKKPRSTSDVLTGTQFLYWHFWPICQDFCPAILTIQAFWPTVALLANCSTFGQFLGTSAGHCNNLCLAAIHATSGSTSIMHSD